MKYLREYVRFLKKLLKPQRRLKVVLDCSNGSVGMVLKTLLKNERRIKAVFINDSPDGDFPAHGPNPLATGAMEVLKKKVISEKADCGMIFDGDGDRVFFVDEKGEVIDQDIAGYLLARRFKSPYVVGITTGSIFNDVSTIQSATGHVSFKGLMRRKKLQFGFERSGHFYFKKFFYADSGIVAGIEFMNALSGLKKPLSEMMAAMSKTYRSPETNFEVKYPAEFLKKIEEAYTSSVITISKLDGLRMDFEWGWFSARASNTENLVRINVEAKEKGVVEKILTNITKYSIV